MTKDIVLVELFSVIGGFHLGLKNAGFNITHCLFSEIDDHAIANYKYNFPDAEHIGSVLDVRGEDIREMFPDSTIVVTFGFPCQDLSIAGKRLGFKGARSSLFYHAARIVRQIQADLYIWENVPGLMSSNGGDDIKAVFEEMYLSGYIFDFEELNTNWVLPQNRSRIYSVGFNIKNLQKCLIETDGHPKNLNHYVKIIQGVLLTKCPDYLTEVPSQFDQKRKDLALDYWKTREQGQYLGQNLKDKFLGIIQTLPLEKLQSLYLHIQSLQLKHNDQNLNTSQTKPQNIIVTDTMSDTEQMSLGKESRSWYIEMLSNNLSAENYLVVSRFIILISINETTKNQTFSYAEMQRNIELFIIHLTILFPNCWEEALYGLIEKKKNINYAQKNRASKRNLASTDDSNAVRFPSPNETTNEPVGYSGAGCFGGLLPITEDDCGSLEGSSASTTVRTITAGGNSAGMHSNMTLIINDEGEFKDRDMATAIDSNYHKGTDSHRQRSMVKIEATTLFDQDTMPTMPTMRKGGAMTMTKKHNWDVVKIKSATKDGYEEATVGDSINLSIPNSATRRGRVGDGQANTLDTQSNQAVIVASRGRGENNEQTLEPNTTNTITGVQKDNMVMLDTRQKSHDQKSGKSGIREYTDESPTISSTIQKDVPKVISQEDNMMLRDGRDNRSCLKSGRQTELGMEGVSIRRLTEVECERLQGFPDNWTKYGIYDRMTKFNRVKFDFDSISGMKEISRSSRYKLCGNAVSVCMPELIGRKILQQNGID